MLEKVTICLPTISIEQHFPIMHDTRRICIFAGVPKMGGQVAEDSPRAVQQDRPLADDFVVVCGCNNSPGYSADRLQIQRQWLAV